MHSYKNTTKNKQTNKNEEKIINNKTTSCPKHNITALKRFGYTKQKVLQQNHNGHNENHSAHLFSPLYVTRVGKFRHSERPLLTNRLADPGQICHPYTRTIIKMDDIIS